MKIGKSESSARNNLINLDYEIVKDKYAILNPEFKLEIWNDKLNSVLEKDWSGDQISFIKTVKLSLNLETFSKSLTSLEGQKQHWAFLSDAKNYFTEVEIYKIFYDVYDFDFDRKDLILGPIPSGTQSGCNCAWDMGCILTGSESCGNNSCRSTSAGCGLLWLAGCNGRCEAGPLDHRNY